MITILTPTYNRAYILHKAYESLVRQTSHDFEWIIIDDGSNDNTEELVLSWVAEQHQFPIIFSKQENGGKHRAVNNGVKLAKSDYVLILDSDDYLTNDAVQKIHQWISQTAHIEDICGVVGFRGFEDGKPLGNALDNEYIDITSLERIKYKITADKAEVYKTKILKEFPFPEFEGENFIRESSSWDRIASAGYKLRYYSDVIYICEYINDGLTKNTTSKTYAKNFQGFLYCTKLYLKNYSLSKRLNKIGEFLEVAKIKKISLSKSAELLEIKKSALIIGNIYYKMRQFLKKTLIKTHLIRG